MWSEAGGGGGGAPVDSETRHWAGMSGNEFCTFGFGIGKWPSLFPTFGIKNGNKKSNSQLLEWGMGIKNQIPNFWDWE